MQHAVIVLPTYNERSTIKRLLNAILTQQQFVRNVYLSIVVVDDSSPDGTSDIVREYAKFFPQVHLLTGRKKQGLGRAYIRGFTYAIRKLHADIVFEMDADFSHSPSYIPRFIAEIERGKDFVIGSRYIRGGSIPADWSWKRKLNSKWGNIFARYIAGLHGVQDCTSGFRAIKTELLRSLHFQKLGVKGYAFQISLLYHALKTGASVSEIPIDFIDRKEGKSKIRFADISEFVTTAFTLRFPTLPYLTSFIFFFFIGFFLGLSCIFLQTQGFLQSTIVATAFMMAFSMAITFQGIFSLYWMLYVWEDIKNKDTDNESLVLVRPMHSFTALIPARHEEKVIADTLHAVSAIEYPEQMKETLVICRSDDVNTILTVQKTIDNIGKSNIKLVVFDDYPINKPHSLNIGLAHATKDIVVVFDAEDQPHKDIYAVVNKKFVTDDSDVVQSGVQLMNYRSRWFSMINVLEYFFWFKSTLHFFAESGVIPLGGNTVFFKRSWLNKIDGWDEECLTEDADIGIRLSIEGAKTAVVYNPRYATQEETPLTLSSFIRQRTRWNHGFLQILLKQEWLAFPKGSQRFLAAYILFLPILQFLTIVFMPVLLYLGYAIKPSVLISLLTIIPLFVLLLQFITYNIGLYEFTKDYRKKYSLFFPVFLLITFFPFQIVLAFSAFRAIVRLVSGNMVWEKTQHMNAHRESFTISPAY